MMTAIQKVNGACFLLIHYARETNAETMRVEQNGVHHKGQQLGDWEVIVRKIKKPVPVEVNYKVSDRELEVLKVLAESYHDVDDWGALYLRGITAETKLDTGQARRAVRSLARKGLAQYERGLVDEEGMMAGAGYRATAAGKKLAEMRMTAAEREKAQDSLL